MKKNHEIDYQLVGDDLQFIIIELDPNETTIAEAGSLIMMDDGISMETILGDGSEQRSTGLMDKMLGAGKRLLTGESLFMTAFTNKSSGKREVAFASPYPGKILPLDLSEYNEKVICQKDAFLAAAKGVSIGIEFQRKIGVGFFGGEGFIMQKLEGDGKAFIHAGGTLLRKELSAGEVLRVDTGCLAAMTGSITYEIEMVKGIKTALFGGEGLFFATLRGPGVVWIQSLPFSRLASRVFAAAPQRMGKQTDEGSVARGVFNLLNGD